MVTALPWRGEAGPGPLDAGELAVRARRVAAVLVDCDGVLTDGGVYYSDEGEAFRRFNVRDGMGVERLRGAGIATAIVTRESSEAIERRAAKLGALRAYRGIADKGARLPEILLELGLEPGQIACMGDDVNDLGLIAAVRDRGLTAAPADAMPEVLGAVHYRSRAPGGHGAFREFAEWILRLRRGTPE